MKSFIYLSIILSCGTSCTSKSERVTDLSGHTDDEIFIVDTLTSRIIFNDSIGWGYQLFKGSKLIVEQEHIPAIQGVKGFETKEKATKAANYVLDKIKRGIFPPTLSVQELDSLNVL